VRRLAGIMKTSTCALHETDLGCRKTSTLLLQLTVREGVCRGPSSGPEPRTELRRGVDESPDTVRVPLAWIALRAFGEIRRDHAAGFMLWGSMGKLRTRKNAENEKKKRRQSQPHCLLERRGRASKQTQS